MSKEILAQLVKIAAKQQKIIEKIAQGLTAEESKGMAEEQAQKQSDIASDLEEARKALMGESQEMGEMEESTGDSDLPSDFDEKFSHYIGQKNSTSHFGRQNYRHTMHQLQNLANNDPSSWEELGEYFIGWTPDHVLQLARKLHEA